MFFKPQAQFVTVSALEHVLHKPALDVHVHLQQHAMAWHDGAFNGGAMHGEARDACGRRTGEMSDMQQHRRAAS